MERASDTGREGHPADYFVVEVIVDDRRRYVLCQRVLVVEEDDGNGLSPEMLDELFERRPLRAVALPTARGGGRWLGRGGGWPQVGRNVNININLPPDV